MASIGELKTFANRIHRFETVEHGEDAWVPHGPWGRQYTAVSIAAAKALVPVDGVTLDEKVIILFDNVGDITQIYTQKPAGYSGGDFDLSFDLQWDSTVTYINDTTLDAILATRDIDTLSGMTSTSANVESAIVDTATNTTTLTGLTNTTLTDAVNDSHTQGTDTGSDKTTFDINSGSATQKATLDTSNLTANTVVDLEVVRMNLAGPGLGLTVQSKTKAEAIALTPSSGFTILITDIDSGKGFLMTYDGTDWTSGVYWMQEGSSTIASGPAVGETFVHLDNFWLCINATAGQEVFQITRQKVVFDHGSTGTILLEETRGSILTNTGAVASVTLTTPASSEVDGTHMIIMKLDADDFIIEDSTATTIIQNTTAELDAVVEIYFANGSWVVGPIVGTWI